MDFITGVDVSHWDGAIDWTKVATDPQQIKFAICKATDGLATVDPTFNKNMDDATANGITVAAYHFFRPELRGSDQANKLLSIVGSRPCPLVMDFELMDGISSVQASITANAFIATIYQKTGKYPIFYSYTSFIQDIHLNEIFSELPLWIASYTPEEPGCPAPFKQAVMWQYTETGVVQGIGTCDMNKFYGTIEQFQSL
jgi:lysozyme